MCFRPPDAKLKPLKCPDCGKRINNPNYRPDKCPFCGAFLPAELDGMDKYLDGNGDAPAPAAPAAPPAGNPAAPKAPGAPKA